MDAHIEPLRRQKSHRVNSVGNETHDAESHYKHLAIMGIVHLPFMYLIMFAMIHSGRELFNNLNTLYMAGMMVAPMIFFMPLLMKKMYSSRRLNWIAYGSSAVLFLSLFLFTRNQTFIGDKQFLRSMIPHHSSAVLMCEKAKIYDPEIKSLCSNIIQNQTSEIVQMKRILERY